MIATAEVAAVAVDFLEDLVHSTKMSVAMASTPTLQNVLWMCEEEFARLTLAFLAM